MSFRWWHRCHDIGWRKSVIHGAREGLATDRDILGCTEKHGPCTEKLGHH